MDKTHDLTPEIISDRYLNQAVGACYADDGGRLVTKPVGALIARYAPSDRPTMNEIPRERRRAFLDELSAITKRALPPYEPIRADPIFLSPDAKLTVKGHEPIPAEPTLDNQDARLIANGYEPIAVNGKAAVAKGWNTRPSTIEAAAAERASHPGAKSTGLRTGCRMERN